MILLAAVRIVVTLWPRSTDSTLRIFQTNAVSSKTMLPELITKLPESIPFAVCNYSWWRAAADATSCACSASSVGFCCHSICLSCSGIPDQGLLLMKLHAQACFQQFLVAFVAVLCTASLLSIHVKYLEMAGAAIDCLGFAAGSLAWPAFAVVSADCCCCWWILFAGHCRLAFWQFWWLL